MNWDEVNVDPVVRAQVLGLARSMPPLRDIDWSVVGFVYFVQRGDDGPIKIGWSTNLGQRLANLQTGSPEPLKLRAALVGTRSLEGKLHKTLGPFRIGSGEWFEPHDVVLSLVSHYQERFE